METRIEWRSIIEFSASFTIDWVLWMWTRSSTLIVSSRLSTRWLIEHGSGRTSRLVLFPVDARTNRSLPMMCPAIRRQKKKQQRQQRKRDTLRRMCNESIYTHAHLCVRYSHQIWMVMLDYPWPEHIHKCAHILITIIFIWISKNFLSQIVSPYNKYAKRKKKSYWTHSHDKREREKPVCMSGSQQISPKTRWRDKRWWRWWWERIKLHLSLHRSTPVPFHFISID